MNKIIFTAAIVFLMSSCLRDTNPEIIDVPDSYLSGPGFFIVNEGNFRAGNGSLSFFSYDSIKVYNNVFEAVNKRPLGDIPYSVSILGSNAYIIVNNSGKIEVANQNYMQSVATYEGIKSPRYMAFLSDAKAYVTSLFSDSITILNLVSRTISGYINLKHTSEQIILYSSSAYVANWVGGNKVMVINTANDEVIDSIEVGMEPESMVLDGNNILWVLCNGGWERDHYAELVGINTYSNMVEKRFTFPSITDSPTCLQISGDRRTLYFLWNGVRRMSVDAANLPTGIFIPQAGYNFYRIAVNPGNSEIFVTDAADYQRRGNILRYNSSGALLSVMQADIIPGNMCYKYNPDSSIQ
jgi:YVTN family beta-propeller protein